jgi:hypothetical protein
VTGLRTPNVNDIPGFDASNGIRNQRKDRLKIDHSITPHVEDDETEMEGGQIMFPLHRFIDGHEDVKVRLGQPEQLAVLDASPSDLRHGPDGMTRERPLQACREAF